MFQSCRLVSHFALFVSLRVCKVTERKQLGFRDLARYYLHHSLHIELEKCLRCEQEVAILSLCWDQYYCFQV